MDPRHVHGGIRHLEIYQHFEDQHIQVHGGIRHLERKQWIE